jgi:hypothetical protein
VTLRSSFNSHLADCAVQEHGENPKSDASLDNGDGLENDADLRGQKRFEQLAIS